MKTLRTFYRLAVMAMTVIVATLAWQLYGPPPEKLQWLAQRGVELADNLVSRFRRTNAEGQAALADPRTQALPYGPAPLEQHAAQPLLSPAPGSSSVTDDANLHPQSPATSPAWSTTPQAVRPTRLGVQPAAYIASAAAPSAPSEEERLQNMIARLEEVGVSDTRLEPWGTSGEFYRFCCRAPWRGESSYTRHFESVAAEPAAAVEQVAAAIAAWQSSGADGVSVR